MTSLADGEPRRRSWFDAWLASAYGPEGFWPRHRPEEHFRTAAASTPLLAEMAAAVIDRTPGVQVVLDLGAGSGQLLTALHELRPKLQLVAVDLRDRPAELPAAVEWARDLWDVRYDRWTTGAALPWLVRPEPVMIICCEWLDDLPVVVVRRHADGWREMIIGDDGAEEFGPRLHEDQLTWADQWWPAGQRAEVGLTRDRAWTALAAVVARRGGCALMIDYGHRLCERPADGSFAAYRDGRAVSPIPSGELNLTAHVSIDSVRAAGEAAGLRTAFCCLQSEVVADLLVAAPDADPLADLARRSQQSALSSHYVWGSHWWLLQTAPAR